MKYNISVRRSRLHVCLVTGRPVTTVCTGLEGQPTDLQGTGCVEE